MSHPGFFKTIEETTDWLNEVGVDNYSIDNETLVVNVDGNVFITRKFEKYIPVKFGKINGFFTLIQNNLISLEGCPDVVTGMFSVAKNYLTNLIGGPKEVGNKYIAAFNKLTSLEGSPKEVNNFDISNNKTLKSYTGGPSIVKRELKASNTMISNFEGFPKYVSNLDISKCNFITLDGIPEFGSLNYSDNNVIDITGLPKGMGSNAKSDGNLIVSFRPDQSNYNGVNSDTPANAAKEIVEILKENPEYKETYLNIFKRNNPDLYNEVLKYDIDDYIERTQNSKKHEDIINL